MKEMDHSPSRWDRPSCPTTIQQNNFPPVSVQVSIAPTFANSNRQDCAIALLAGIVLGVATILFLGEDNGRPPRR